MKKLITISSALLILTGSAMAQEGSWYIGGNAGFNSKKTTSDIRGTKSDDIKNTEWSFAPEVGTFLSNNLQVGVGLNFGGNKITDYNSAVDRETTVSRFGGTLYARYFFGKGNFRPFLGANLSLLPGSAKIKSIVNTEDKYNTFDWGININAGFAYALNSRVTVVGSFGAIGFSSNSVSSKDGDYKQTTSGFGFENAGTLGNRFTVGVYYTFKK